MDKTNEIAAVIAELMREKYGSVAKEAEGFSFAAVDINLITENKFDVYRITF